MSGMSVKITLKIFHKYSYFIIIITYRPNYIILYCLLYVTVSS